MKERSFLACCGLMLVATSYVLAIHPQWIVNAFASAVLTVVFVPILTIPCLWVFGR